MSYTLWASSVAMENPCWMEVSVCIIIYIYICVYIYIYMCVYIYIYMYIICFDGRITCIWWIFHCQWPLQSHLDTDIPGVDSMEGGADPARFTSWSLGASLKSLSKNISIWVGSTRFTLWLFNIAMENGPLIDDFPIKTSIYSGFSMAMLVITRW